MTLLGRLGKHRHKVLPGISLLVGLTLALVYRHELGAWFSGETAGHQHASSSAEQAPSRPEKHEAAPSEPERPGSPELPAHRFEDPALGRLREALAAYEQIRARLAKDAMSGVDAYAAALGQALDAVASSGQKIPAAVRQVLLDAAKAAESLGRAEKAEQAREHFGELSRNLVALVASDPRLGEGLHLFECPMTEGFQKWFQPDAELENPYMGQSMPACGAPSKWSEAKIDHSEHQPEEAGPGEVAYYTCPMHPSVRQEAPGKCPICGMDLTPVTKQQLETGTILVDEVRRQRIGVRTAPASRQKLELRIRAVGEVKVDETRLSDVNLRMSGWVQRLSVNETGQRVDRGQTLFTLYSPELYTAQLEYLASARRQSEAASDLLSGLMRAARQRLRLLGMTDAQTEALEKRGEALEHVPITAPASGYVIEKNVVEGARVDAGMLVYRIADLSRVWIDAEVYESDLPHVRVGQGATVRLPYVPDKSYEGKVDFIYPTLQSKTRTGRARVVLKNQDLELKPDMYANVEIIVELGERLTIPDSAVLYTGPRRLVFVDLGEGRLSPRVVKLGVHAQGMVEVTEGLVPGEVVVTSGNFLIAAESRLRSATDYWQGSHAGH